MTSREKVANLGVFSPCPANSVRMINVLHIVNKAVFKALMFLKSIDQK